MDEIAILLLLFCLAVAIGWIIVLYRERQGDGREVVSVKDYEYWSGVRDYLRKLGINTD